MADTRMYIDEQAACDAKTCMTEEGGGTWATDTICTLEQPWTAADGSQAKWKINLYQGQNMSA